jgi:hypothetical protein
MTKYIKRIKIILRELRRIHMSDKKIKAQEELEQKKIVGENQLLVNGKVMNKLSVVSHIAEWVRQTFVFRSGEVFLPEEKPLPVNDVEEELTKIKNFKGTGLKALDYLILVVLAMGIKMGREMERNEQLGKSEE